MKQFLIAALLMIQTTFALPTTSVTVAWDSSPSTTVTGYKLYYSIAAGTYTATNSVDVGNVTTYQVNYPLLKPGTKQFLVVTAYDATKLESGFSNEISFMIPLPPLNVHMTPQALVINSFTGANLVVESSSDLKTWSSTNLTALSDTTTIPIMKTSPQGFFQVFYADAVLPQIHEQVQLPPPLPPLALTKREMLKLLMRYRPGHHPSYEKGGEALMRLAHSDISH